MADLFEEACGALKHHFGYDAFRPGQGDAIKAILAGRDCLGVMPTGAGKSLCYQVPGIVLPGLTLVVSPLVSLMGDQVRSLTDAGVRGAYLNSSLTPGQQATVLHRAAEGAYDLMYVAPERLADERFASFAREAGVALIAVDEAHCVSQWGQDFRPSYLTIGDFIASLPARPIVAAFTATATERVRADIVRLLGLSDPFTVVTGFDRPNLYFGVERLAPKRRLERVCSYAAAHPLDSGIVYCSTRKATEEVCQALVDAGVRAVRYHAGLPSAERTEAQRAFIDDDAPVMVATNAFGMGIDKSNVRYVIHYNLPGSIEAYYQEAGRAGRDGEPAECLLLWGDADVATCRFFIEQEVENEQLTPEEAEVARSARRRMLESMVGYCLTTSCLRSYILRYFGEDAGLPAGAAGESAATPGAAGADDAAVSGAAGADGAANASEPATAHGVAAALPTCDNCSNCEGGFEAVDVTEEARCVMRCVQEMRGRFGKGVVVDVLRGSKAERIASLGLDRATSFGTSHASAAQLKEVIELLCAGGYLAITEGKYPLVGFGPRVREVASKDFSLTMKRVVRSSSRSRSSARTANLIPVSEELFERLRVLRKRLASEAGLPPYLVLSDAALRDMCAKMPTTPDEFLDVSGVGQKKLDRYGEVFMAELASWKAEHGA